MLSIPALDKLYPAPLTKVTVASGASQTPAYLAQAADGQSLFIKHDPAESGLLLAEADGLKTLTASRALRIPQVFTAQKTWLVMEAIDREPAQDLFWKRLAEGLVNLHHCRDSLGAAQDNFIGRHPQYNQWPSKDQNWQDFFWQKRLMPQIANLRLKNIWTAVEDQKLQRLESCVRHSLAAVREEPSLLHGDFWSGNILCGINQEPVLIDPASYYGHRETDLAMSTLFGGFSPVFYRRYYELMPLAAGFEKRREIYNFYHKLNHANLYGSGFIWDVKKTLHDLCDH